MAILKKKDAATPVENRNATEEKKKFGVNPDISIFRVSSRDGSGLDQLAAWIAEKVDEVIQKGA